MGLSHKFNVLFIDDDKVILSIYKIWFKDDFKNLYVANNKEELDKIIKTKDINIVLCDIRLKNNFYFLGDGFDVIEYIRNNYNNKLTFFIISAMPKEFYMEELKKYKYIQGIIEKPFDKRDIMKFFEE